MCLVCGRLWTALQVLWSTFYVICGAAQLMVGVFFLISVPEIQLYGVLVDGAWVSLNNIVIHKIKFIPHTLFKKAVPTTKKVTR